MSHALNGETGMSYLSTDIARQRRRAAFASAIGSVIEWYDFFVYPFAATVAFPKLFFGTHDPVTGTALSLLTFLVAYAARPIGGLVLGHYGDRIGRKAT